MDTSLLFLAAAGLLGGAMNAMAGGGSFVTLPSLIAAGLPSVSANASSTVALYPGGLMSVVVYRDGLSGAHGLPLRAAFVATLVGGLAGALLLLSTPSSLFDRVLPWLLLAATAALAFGPRLGPLVRARFRAGITTVLILQFALGVYGGYFGGAVGLMMLACWGLLAGADLKTLNPPRVLLTTAANTVAALLFAFAGVVRWPQTLALGAGALVGGYLGARVGRALPPTAVRIFTVSFAALVTALFFRRAYG